ncbi:hypothetical protein EN792_064220 [Mesorhizobium sp. M00.F.Ca.ET.149.01.1.1]|nr:hypothetical protein EN792_064220 [Mesorhizobium sp. M00.F.Ca.ET.149.01.1.1]
MLAYPAGHAGPLAVVSRLAVSLEDRNFLPIVKPHLVVTSVAGEFFDVLDPIALPYHRPMADWALKDHVLIEQFS